MTDTPRAAGAPPAAGESLADSKAIGEDVEHLAIEATRGLEPADARNAWFDAITTRAVGPRTTDDVVFAGICVVPRDTQVEIKATQRTVSKGAEETQPGRWYFKRSQHDRLLTERACYLLALYDDDGAARELTQLVVTPTAVIDECLRRRWYDVDRAEGRVAQLAWPHLLGEPGGASA